MSAAKPTGFKRPNFFVIGAEKAGTTSLCELLSQHPDVFFSNPKEPNFFTLSFGECDSLKWYESLFASAAAYKLVGEGSTTYSKRQTYPRTAQRIASYAPDAKIVYIVRSPLPRVESQWIQRRSVSIATPRNFSVAVREDQLLLDASLYWQNLSAYRDHFDDSQILLLFLEDMKADSHATLQTCFKFLQVDPEIALNDADRPRNPADEKREDGSVLNVARRFPLFKKFRDRFIPHAVRRICKPLLTKPIGQRPEWDDQTRLWFLEQIAADNASLLEYAGKPADFWDPSAKKDSSRAA
jgi:hypothetical protein